MENFKAAIQYFVALNVISSFVDNVGNGDSLYVQIAKKP